MERGSQVWETKAGVIAACQPSMEEPRDGDGAGMDETKEAFCHQNDIFLAVYKGAGGPVQMYRAG